MTNHPFTEGHPVDLDRIEAEARRLRAETIRAGAAAFGQRISALWATLWTGKRAHSA